MLGIYWDPNVANRTKHAHARFRTSLHRSRARSAASAALDFDRRVRHLHISQVECLSHKLTLYLQPHGISKSRRVLCVDDLVFAPIIGNRICGANAYNNLDDSLPVTNQRRKPTLPMVGRPKIIPERTNPRLHVAARLRQFQPHRVTV